VYVNPVKSVFSTAVSKKQVGTPLFARFPPVFSSDFFLVAAQAEV
jgi:hypothetical protein